MSSPSEHYAKAELLMQRVSDMDATLPICRALTAQAHVHALLAAYTPPPESYHDYTFRDGFPRETTRIKRAKDKYL